MGSRPKVHPFTYFNSPKDNSRDPRIHQRRDLAALIELLARLWQMGYVLGEQILNYPPDKRPGRGDPPRQLDLSFVEPGDLILQATRPPLDDLAQGNRKQVRRGYTDVEQRLFELWRRYLDVCSRGHVMLAEEVRQALPRGYESRQDMWFFQGETAPYKELNALDGRGPRKPDFADRTVAFLLWEDETWEGGPGTLAVFGMDGISTQVWAYRLARDLAHLLEPGFVLAEMKTAPIPERPTDLRWAEKWEIDVLVALR